LRGPALVVKTGRRNQGAGFVAEHKYPVVDEQISIGEAARAATEASVGAVVVPTGGGYALVDVGGGGDVEHDARVGEIAVRSGTMIEGAVDIIGPMASVGGRDLDFRRFDVAAGYKECNLDSSHVYPANYPGSSCPEADGGTLSLVML
jgi:hypothetical protein